VHEDKYDTFVKKCVEIAKGYKLGDQFDSKTDQGPQIDKEQMEKILVRIEC
jgi:coniferyl-aldehyde dehydrogenase